MSLGYQACSSGRLEASHLPLLMWASKDLMQPSCRGLLPA